MLRSPWYNLDVCGLTNPMSAYLQKRQHSCAAILARFFQVSHYSWKFLLNHPKQNRRIYKTHQLCFSLGVWGWRDGVFLEQCQTKQVNDVNEAATSFGWAHPFWSIGILGGVLIRIGELDWAVSYRECCGPPTGIFCGMVQMQVQVKDFLGCEKGQVQVMLWLL